MWQVIYWSGFEPTRFRSWIWVILILISERVDTHLLSCYSKCVGVATLLFYAFFLNKKKKKKKRLEPLYNANFKDKNDN